MTDNLFGDILTDLAGAVAGGIGFAASANLNPARTGPSLFEPVHGAAHDIAGQGHRQPLGRHPLGRAHARLPGRGRCRTASAQGARPPSPMPCPSHSVSAQPLSTTAVGDAISERL